MKAGADSRIVVVKCGAAGCVVRDGGEVFRCPAFPLTRPVQDTVGAGDSFQAAFLYFHIRGLPTRLAAVLASANAAATVQESGGVLGQQDREGLAAMLEHTRITMSDRHGLEIGSR
jgi:sugar/nucleoside kinase (ribokinase family)